MPPAAAYNMKPDYPSAHSFVVLAVTITIICAIMNPLSLFFGIPALAMAILVSSLLSGILFPKIAIIMRSSSTLPHITLLLDSYILMM